MPAASQVRAWAVPKGLAKPGRGRLSKVAVKAYNRSHHRAQYASGS